MKCAVIRPGPAGQDHHSHPTIGSSRRAGRRGGLSAQPDGWSVREREHVRAGRAPKRVRTRRAGRCCRTSRGDDDIREDGKQRGRTARAADPDARAQALPGVIVRAGGRAVVGGVGVRVGGAAMRRCARLDAPMHRTHVHQCCLAPREDEPERQGRAQCTGPPEAAHVCRKRYDDRPGIAREMLARRRRERSRRSLIAHHCATMQIGLVNQPSLR
jgi:hypothetical protein